MVALNARYRRRDGPRRNTLGNAIAKEAALPATCYRLDYTGALSEGIELSLNHPLTGGKPALLVGETYILRNYERGCLYEPRNGGVGLVRRAVLETKVFDGGKKSLLLLTQPSDENTPTLLHVSFPETVRPKERFWVGVSSSDKVTVLIQDSGEMLVSFSGEDSGALIFGKDGGVRRVIYKNRALRTEALTIEEQSVARIARVDRAMEEEGARKNPGENPVPKEDAMLHELIAVMAIGGKHSEVVFAKVYNSLRDKAKKGGIRPAVKDHAVEALKKQWPANALCLARACR